MWWATFISTWNGTSVITCNPRPAPNHVWTDASGSFGCGAIYPAMQRWLQLRWPSKGTWAQLQESSIAVKELLLIVLACAVWGSQWRCLVVTIHCDNTEAVAAINSGYSRVTQIMHLL